jgi:transcription termination factor NusB
MDGKARETKKSVKGGVKARNTSTLAEIAQTIDDTPIDRLKLVRAMIQQCTTVEGAGTNKPVVAELIRLLALEKELSEEHQVVREIRVQWVEPTETESPK